MKTGIERRAFAADVCPSGVETARPFSQGVGVIDAETLDSSLAQSCLFDHRGDALLGRKRAAGEDVLLDEIRARVIVLEQAVLNGDDLQARAPAGLKDIVDLLKIGRPVLAADCFEHLD